MATATQTAKSVRTILGDFNFWPTSESDSPLTVKVKKGSLDDPAILKIDAAMRKKVAEGDLEYKVPNRIIKTGTIIEVFLPLIKNSIGELVSTSENINSGGATINDLELAAEQVEMLVQLAAIFNSLNQSRVLTVSPSRVDSEDPYVGLLIAGEVANETEVSTIIAQTLLVQT